jgi:GTP-binding protein LepA
MDAAHIRNFSIIAHIDHGKTTLVRSLLSRTGTIADRDMQDQMLDSMDLERERGITIKAHPVTMLYRAKDGETYELNLIDTPGHVDFAYEVSRSLSACEGALLIIDAAQGVEAQTVANVHLAMKQNLAIIPVINKIDLPHADVALTRTQLEDILAIPGDSAILASAKDGIGIDEILEAIIHRIPAPKTHRRTLGAGARLRFALRHLPRRGQPRARLQRRIARRHVRPVASLGEDGRSQGSRQFQSQTVSAGKLEVGETGYITANIKSPKDVKMGDTLTDSRHPSPALPGFQEIHPMVFSGIYPINTADYEHLKANLAKLQLNDSAFVYQAESSVALGFGFRCGFLGLLHLEIVQERLRREYGMDIIATYPSVIYRVTLTAAKSRRSTTRLSCPSPRTSSRSRNPWSSRSSSAPTNTSATCSRWSRKNAATSLHTETLDTRRVMLTSRVPLNEILIDFHDRIKSLTRGYGSMDYEHDGHDISDMVKLELLVNSEPVDAFSCIVHRAKAEGRGRALAAKLKDVIPRQQFQVAIQAAIGGKVVARETVSALRKDVTAKCYGGDITRKRKLLEKQKEGKKRMKSIGSVHIPQQAFIEVLKA